jgi:hypothetical protein
MYTSIVLKQGINKVGNKGIQGAIEELKQLRVRQVLKPININDLINNEKYRAMESLIFLLEKKDQRIKARTWDNGSIQRTYICKDEATSPTVSTKAILLTEVIVAKKERDIMTAGNIPGIKTYLKYMKLKVNSKGNVSYVCCERIISGQKSKTRHYAKYYKFIYKSYGANNWRLEQIHKSITIIKVYKKVMFYV